MTLYFLLTRLKEIFKSSLAATVISALGIIATLLALPFGVIGAATVAIVAIVIFLIWLLFAWRFQYPPSSHWIILDSSHTWEIENLAGTNASYRKVIKARCEANGAFAWRDFIFGSAEEIQPHEYETPNGNVCEIRRDVDGYYALVSLHNIYNKTDEIVYEAEYPVRNAFSETRGWVAVRMTDTARGPSYFRVVFPFGAQLEGPVTLEENFLGALRTREINHRVETLDENGKPKIVIDYSVQSPRPGATYTIRWNRRAYIEGLDMAEGVLLSAGARLEKHGVEQIVKESRLKVSGASVFISHGKQTPALDKVERFIRALGLEPVIVTRRPSEGMAVDDLVEARMDECDCAIILATAEEEIDGRRQPRPNVIHEIGLAQGKLENKVVYLKENGCEFPSNVRPKVWESFTQDNLEAAFEKISKELHAFGFI